MQVNGGGTVFVTAGELSAASDTVQPQVTIRDPNGSERTEGGSGASLASVVELANLAPETVRLVTVARTNNPGLVTITHAELTDGFRGVGSESRTLLATVLTSDTVRFFRPLRPPDGGVEDANGKDFIVTGGDLSIGVETEGPTLQVRGRATPDTPDPGTPVTFTATPVDPPAGATLTYAWDFGDGTGAKGQTVTKTYTDAGLYRATVTLVADKGAKGAGTSDPVTVQVGSAPAPSATPTASAAPGPDGPSSGSGTGGAGSGGPESTGGGTGDKNQPASGRRDGKQRGATNRRPGRRRDGGRSATPTPDAPSAAASSQPTVTPAAPTAAPSTGAGSPDTSGSKPSGPDEPGAPKPAGTPAAATAGRDAAISGTLVSGTGPEAEIGDLLASAGAAPELAPAAPARAGGGSDGGVLAPVGGSLAVFALLAAGALRERGVRLGLRRWWPW